MAPESTTTTIDLTGAVDVSQTVNGSSSDEASHGSDLANDIPPETKEETGTTEPSAGNIPRYS
jgi:hypothetical protein